MLFSAMPQTNDSNADVKKKKKKKSYSRLSTIFQNYQRRNITIMMGDVNAKTGSDNRGYEDILG